MDIPAAHIFGQEQLAKAIATLNSSDNNPASNAVLGSVDATGIQVVASFYKPLSSGQTWVLQAVARHDWRGDNDAEIKVILKW